MFERTGPGQEQRAEFLNVDIVCYVEGGEDEREASPDATFWSVVFETLRPGKTIRCIPKGGKPILEGFARQVVGGQLSNVIVAMDADYDHVIGDLIVDKRVLYTWGYSWENDLYSDEVLIKTFTALTHRGSCSAPIKSYICDEVAKIIRSLRWCVKADHAALCKGTSMLPRDAPGRLFCSDQRDDPPSLRLDEARKLLRAARLKMKNKPVEGVVSDTRRFLIGHYLQHAISLVLRSAVNRFHKRMNVPQTVIRDLALQIFRQFLQNNVSHPVRDHHFAQCQAV